MLLTVLAAFVLSPVLKVALCVLHVSSGQGGWGSVLVW